MTVYWARIAEVEMVRKGWIPGKVPSKNPIRMLGRQTGS
jgi:hypothetical protein